MLKSINKLKNVLFGSFTPPNNETSNYIELIKNILNNPDKTNLEKQKIIQKLLKLITNKIQIYYNETVLFHGDKEFNHMVFNFNQTLPFAFVDYPNEICPYTFLINKTPCFSLVWRSDRIINTFSNIGQKGYNFQKQDNLENVVIHPLGIVVGFGNNHSTNAGLLENAGESKINYELILTRQQVSDVLKKSKSQIDCPEITLLLKIAQLFIDYDFKIDVQ